LRHQLGEVLKQKKKVIESPTEFGHGKESEAESNAIESASEEEPLLIQQVKKGLY